MVRLPDLFGRPHLHSGVGIRPFSGFYECRVGRDLRVLFVFDEGNFIHVTAGNQGGVARLKRENS